MLGAVNSWLKRKPWTDLAVLCTLAVLTVGSLDAITGYEISFGIFYLAPIAVAAWYSGKRLGLFTSALSAMAYFSANLLAGVHYSHPAILFWNVVVLLGFFAITAQLICKVRFHLGVEERLARIDPLTEALNWRAFKEEAERYLDLAARHGHAVTLVYLDVDDFKGVNDRWGHSEGDRLLKSVAATLKKSARSSDLVARLGGDEFALLLPETDESGAKAFVEKIRRAHAGGSDGGPGATFSLGVVTFRTTPESIEKAVFAADTVMYHVKSGSKNDALFAVVGAATDAVEETPAGK